MLLILKSRTLWTLVFMLSFNVFAAVYPFYTHNIAMIVVNAVLTTLAGYFKLNPSQAYGQETPVAPQVP